MSNIRRAILVVFLGASLVTHAGPDHSFNFFSATGAPDRDAAFIREAVILTIAAAAWVLVRARA